MKSLPPDHRPIGRCLIVAEVAQAHDGSLGTAHAFIDAIADAGADAAKFQTHIAAAESTPSEVFRVRFSPQDDTRYDYWKRMEFTPEQWHGLKRHADERGLKFLSSPFSIEAVDLLTDVGVFAWKIASGEVGSFQMFERMAATGLPFILSSGMSSFAVTDKAVDWIQSRCIDLTLLQCTTAYPCPPENIGLNLLGELQQRYGCPVGLSDHSGTIYPGLAAATLGAAMIEVHVTFSKQMFGPDVPASLTLEQLAQLVEGVRYIEAMQANPIDKDAQAAELEPLLKLFSKSVVAARDLSAGHVLVGEDLVFKKPGTGIPAARLDTVIGRRLARDVMADALLSEGDLE